MTTQSVPGDVRDFILKHIDSVAQVEALLLIWSNPEKRWSASMVAARIYIGQAEAAQALAELCAHDLLVHEGDTFSLNASKENIDKIAMLKEAYARHLIPVTDVIHSKSGGPRAAARLRGHQGD